MKYKKPLIISGIILVVVLVLFITGRYFLRKYTVTTIYVNGNLHYSDEEIIEKVTGGRLGRNSIYLSMKYKYKEVKDIPFVDVLEVNVLSPDTIKIVVYEKALAGYVKYLDTYMYFDKDGYLVECSSEPTAGVPYVTGITFSHMVLGQQLPAEDVTIFNTVLNLTKLLKKYSLNSDRIHFNKDAVTLYFGNVRVELGKDMKNVEDKFMLLPEFLSRLEGKSGVLNMDKTAADKSSYTFKPD